MSYGAMQTRTPLSSGWVAALRHAVNLLFIDGDEVRAI